MKRFGTAIALALVLAACSGQPAAENNTAAANDAAPANAEAVNIAEPANASNATVGGDGSEITLSGLTAADVEGAKLDGELGCSFSAGGSEILVAMGYADSPDAAQGVVKVGDYVEPVSAPGGFDAMVKGPVFAGKGKTITIAVTGKPKDGSESPPVPATLTYQRADGASRAVPGDWTCGP